MKQGSFLDIFEKLSSTDSFEKKFILNIEKICKFCSKTSSQTTFNSIPHVIPELFGKNNYSSNEECDNCNQLFGRFETDLANYISPYQTLIGQRTKRKIPIFQSRKKSNENSTIIKNEYGNLNFDFGKNLSDFEIDTENQQFSVIIKKKKFIPINVFKGLVKIGLSLCPKHEIIKYTKTIKWLSHKVDNQNHLTFDISLHLIRTRLSNKYYPKPSATLFKRKDKISNNIFRPNFKGFLIKT